MNERLLQTLQKKDNYSINQYNRIEHLANYMRRRGFNRNYEENVIKLITYYSYIKSIDTKGYHKCYVSAFTSYINKHYDEAKTKSYFDGNISENEFLEEFIHHQREEENKQFSKKKEGIFKIVKSPTAIKTKTLRKKKQPNLVCIKIKEGIINMHENIQCFLERISWENPFNSRKREIANWWKEYLENLEETQKSEDYINFFGTKKENTTQKIKK